MQRFENYVYKGCPGVSEFREKLHLAAQKIGAKIIWDTPGDSQTCLSTSDENDIHKVQLSRGSPFEEKFYREVGRVSGLPWINFRIPGAPLWLYTLYLGDEQKDSFNPCPELREDPDNLSEAELAQLVQRWPGNAELLSQL